MAPRTPSAAKAPKDPGVKPPLPTAQAGAPAAAAARTAAHPDFGWALNPHKLKSASQYVDETQPKLSPKDRHDAIKERYAEIKGTLAGAAPTRAARSKPTVENLSEHDGTADTEDDENEESVVG